MVVWITTKKMSDFFDQNNQCETVDGPYLGISDIYSTGLAAGSLGASNSTLYNIRIEALDYGYLVKVGCQTLAIENKKKLIEKLSAYLDNPGEFQQKWNADRSLLMS